MTPDTLKIALDTVWTVLAACLVFWMSAGFAMIEAGFSRSKHALHVLAMNFGVVGVVGLLFWSVGFAVAFGVGSSFAGWTGFFPALHGDGALFPALSGLTVPIAAVFLFHLVFADAAATIVSGTVAERMKFSAYILFSALMVTVLYPVTTHWIWGGGWLSQLSVPFQDFAGSTAVHSVGGWAALTGTIVLGPRLGRFAADGTPRAMPAHDMAIATLGAFILYLGWFGFNAGSTLAADPLAIAHICGTTMLAGAAGMCAATMVAWFRQGVPDVGLMLNGTLAGLVAVTAGCNAVSMSGAVVIGLVAGLLCAFMGGVFEKLKIDDPVGALPVHLVNGIWGTLAVGLFATKLDSVGPFDGLFYGGGTDLLVTQLTGVVAVGAYVLAGSLLCWGIVKVLLGGLRVTPEVELQGLDKPQHGAVAYVLVEETVTVL